MKHKHTVMHEKKKTHSNVIRSLSTLFRFLLCHLATGNRFRMSVNLLNVEHLNEMTILPPAYSTKRASKIIRLFYLNLCFIRLSSFGWLNSAKTQIYRIKMKWFLHVQRTARDAYINDADDLSYYYLCHLRRTRETAKKCRW